MITIVDYGRGNIRALLNVYKRLNLPARAVQSAEQLRGADKVILPGVGAFDQVMQGLDQSGMRPDLEDLALGQKVPVLGICVGMQILGSRSDEGDLSGLGWIPGTVRRFQLDAAGKPLALPHMGWNTVRPAPGTPLFARLESGARFYFLHSYFFSCERADESAAEASYGVPFTCAVAAGNIFGVQFHPEKSHHWGEQLLKNFAEL